MTLCDMHIARVSRYVLRFARPMTKQSKVKKRSALVKAPICNVRSLQTTCRRNLGVTLTTEGAVVDVAYLYEGIQLLALRHILRLVQKNSYDGSIKHDLGRNANTCRNMYTYTAGLRVCDTRVAQVLPIRFSNITRGSRLMLDRDISSVSRTRSHGGVPTNLGRTNTVHLCCSVIGRRFLGRYSTSPFSTMQLSAARFVPLTRCIVP
jgi:hypothetical protein